MTTKARMMLSAVALCVAAPASAQVAPQSAPTQFKEFRVFMQDVANAPATSFVGAPGSKVRDAAALEEMRAHILRMYTGMPVINSFEHDGQTLDCVPVMAQPSARLRGITRLASPPPTPTSPNLSLSDATRPQIPPMSFDAHGNLKACASGNVPIRRVTLEETSRFETLAHFFQKGPDGAGQAKPPGGDGAGGSENALPCAPGSGGSCHAHAYGYQSVTSYGVSSTLELWNPTVGPHQVFSLSQLWIVNTQGMYGNQTVESGWQVFPTKYGTSNAVLFIFSTPDGYQTGCYNLDCPNFIQMDNSVVLGSTFPRYSYVEYRNVTHLETARMTWRLNQGNWWLQYGSTWVGYYPGYLYDQIPSLGTSANLIEFGGETVGGVEENPPRSRRFVPTWPQMGNGNTTLTPGLTAAARQSNIWYYNSTGGGAAYSSLVATSDTSSACYTSSIGGASVAFGGPGGIQAC